MSATSTQTLPIRPGAPEDLNEINTIYNHFVVETPATFDMKAITARDRERWFGQFDSKGPYRLLVATLGARVIGFAYSKEFRQRQAYETSVETSIYLDPESLGRGIGMRLYSALFTALEGEDLHRAYAAITVPNAASIALHQKLGFRSVGTYDEVGRKFGRYWSVSWYEKRLP